MKQLVCAILGVAVIGGGIALSASRQKNPGVHPVQARTESASNPAMANNPPAQPAVAAPALPQPVPADTGDSKPAVTAMASASSAARTVDPAISKAIESLLSKQLTHEQRRDILKQLVQSGKIDQAISELQQQAANDPNNAELQTALGQAYLEKGKTMMQDDVAGGSMLIMQGMKSFDAALSLDPSNWEAAFTKAAVMSHYPAELNQGQAVVNQFTQLINQQESQPPQAQFAMSYVLLGDQYQKLGQNDYALATWQAGAQLFPSDKTLQKRLTQSAGQ